MFGDSIFDRLDRWLNRYPEHRKAVAWLAVRKDMDRYRSFVDFLFCEVFPEWQSACFEFYDKGKLQLRDLILESERVDLERRLIWAVRHAHHLHRRGERVTWTQFREQVTVYFIEPVRPVE